MAIYTARAYIQKRAMPMLHLSMVNGLNTTGFASWTMASFVQPHYGYSSSDLLFQILMFFGEATLLIAASLYFAVIQHRFNAIQQFTSHPKMVRNLLKFLNPALTLIYLITVVLRIFKLAPLYGIDSAALCLFWGFVSLANVIVNYFVAKNIHNFNGIVSKEEDFHYGCFKKYVFAS